METIFMIIGGIVLIYYIFKGLFFVLKWLFIVIGKFFEYMYIEISKLFKAILKLILMFFKFYIRMVKKIFNIRKHNTLKYIVEKQASLKLYADAIKTTNFIDDKRRRTKTLEYIKYKKQLKLNKT